MNGWAWLLDRAIDGLVGAVTDLADDDLLAALQDFERARNRLALVDHALLARADRAQTAERHCFSSLERLMVSALRVSPAEARRRVRAAAVVGPRESMTGEPLAPRYAELAGAQAAGTVSPEQVAVLERALGRVDIISPAQAAAVEISLTEYTRVFAPPELARIADRMVDAIDPDGTRPRDLVQRDLRLLRLTTRRDGMLGVEGRLTPAAGAQLQAVLGPLAKPRQTALPGPRGGQLPVADPRNHEQRMHDALEEACARLLKGSDLPASGGTPATVILTIGLDQLAPGVGLAAGATAQTSTGEVLSIAEALRLAAEAEIVPVVCATAGRPLHLGRTRRIATTAQTYALIARDGGCSFPGCSMRPEWCDRHHIVDWFSGGATDVDNLTLLCRYHHTHFVGAGWTCELDADQLPTWRPPRWMDPAQTPLQHHRIRERRRPSA